MAAEDDLVRLKRMLRWEGAGPLTDVSNQITSALFAGGRAMAQWLRETAEERPLISVLLALQLGFAVGRWEPRRAKH